MTESTNEIIDEDCTDIYEPSENFHSEIKRLRVKNNFTQDAFARELSVDGSSVRNWEKGRALPHNSTCAKIISVLHLTEEEIPLLFIVHEKPESEETEILEESEGEATKEAAISAPQAKPLITIFKETWFKIRKPFVIGVLIWFAAWVVIALVTLIASAIEYPLTDASDVTNLAFQGEIIIVSWSELILYCIASLLSITAISVLTYIILKKVKRK